MEALARQFETQGYLVVRGLLTPEQTADAKKKIQAISHWTDGDFDREKARRRGWSFPDGVTRSKELWPIIFNPKLIATIREALGPTARYTQHSDLHVHHGAVGWHRDNKDRIYGKGPDWDESRAPYAVARVGIYLQSFEESGSALGFIPGSHKKESPFLKVEMRLHDEIRNRFKRPDWLLPLFSVRPVWIKTEPGDCVIFNQRLYHTGTHIHGPKYAIFLSYGMDNEHSCNHRRYYLAERKDTRYEDYAPELKEQLRQADLLLDL